MFKIIAGQSLIMFLLILVGVTVFRTHLADHQGSKTLSNILLMVVNPFVILNSFLSIKYNAGLVQGFCLALLLGFLSHFAGIAVAHVLIRKHDNPDFNIERYSSTYSNCGFMGIPLVGSILGAEGIFFLTAYLVAFNVLTWTHGLVLITGDTSAKQIRKGLMSPAMFAIAAGLACFFFRVHLPSHLSAAVEYMGSMNTPMGMLVAGVALGEANLVPALRKAHLYLVCLLKLIIMPLCTMCILLAVKRMIPISDPVFYTILIGSACPAATTGTMFALRYDGNYRYASELFVLSTLLSMATVPFIVFLAEKML